jgi:hypothetical protein
MSWSLMVSSGKSKWAKALNEMIPTLTGTPFPDLEMFNRPLLKSLTAIFEKKKKSTSAMNACITISI